MTELSHAAAAPGAVPQTAAAARHPSTFAPATFVFLIVLCLFGAVIGVQLILQLGITPNTSIIGALIAMLLARVPFAIFRRIAVRVFTHARARARMEGSNDLKNQACVLAAQRFFQPNNKVGM